MLEKELALFFPQYVKVVLLMGDAAIKAVNEDSLCVQGGKRVTPAGSTYKIREQAVLLGQYAGFSIVSAGRPQFFHRKSQAQDDWRGYRRCIGVNARKGL